MRLGGMCKDKEGRERREKEKNDPEGWGAYLVRS